MKTQLLERGRRFQKFVFQDMWELEGARLGRFYALSVHVLKLSFLAAKSIRDTRIFLHAATLTYTTLLSIVPMLAVMVIVLQQFAESELAKERVWQPVTSHLAAGTGERLVAGLKDIVDGINVRAIGTVGMVILVYVVVSLLTKIEVSFNEIWGVRKKRGLLQRFAAYWSVVTLLPVLLVGSTTLTASFQNAGFAQRLSNLPVLSTLLKGVPFVFVWTGFTLLYLYMPNTRVKLKSAAIGAFVGSALWSAAKWGYIHYAAHSAKAQTFGKIYGGLAAIPTFLIWVDLSWIVILFGAHISYADQNVEAFEGRKRRRRFSHAFRELLGLRIVSEIACAFHGGRSGPTREDLSERFGTPIYVVQEVVDDLGESGFVTEVAEGYGGRLQPTRSLEKIRVDEVLMSIRHLHEVEHKLNPDEAEEYLRGLLRQAEGAARQSLDEVNLKDVAEKMAEMTQLPGETSETSNGPDEPA